MGLLYCGLNKLYWAFQSSFRTSKQCCVDFRLLQSHFSWPSMDFEPQSGHAASQSLLKDGASTRPACVEGIDVPW